LKCFSVVSFWNAFLYHLYKLASTFDDEEIIEKWKRWAKLIIRYEHENYKDYSKELIDVFGYWTHLIHRFEVEERTKDEIAKKNRIEDGWLEKRFPEFKKDMGLDWMVVGVQFKERILGKLIKLLL
jgi:hypothetical protein